MKNKLAELLANGTITVEELAGANELIEQAKLITEGIKACQKLIYFPLGTSEVECYNYTDAAGEYHAWGTCSSNGIFICSTSWGGTHELGRCNLNDAKSIFEAMDKDDELACNIERFLREMIQKAK